MIDVADGVKESVVPPTSSNVESFEVRMEVELLRKRGDEHPFMKESMDEIHHALPLSVNRVEQSTMPLETSNVESSEVNMDMLGNKGTEPPFMKSIDELRSLSSVMQEFQFRWDELQQHLKFIENAIERREKQLLTAVESPSHQLQQDHSVKALGNEETVASIANSEEASDCHEIRRMDPMEVSNLEISSNIKAVEASNCNEPSNTNVMTACDFNKFDVLRQGHEPEEKPMDGISRYRLHGTELEKLCRKMCGPELRKYITSHLSEYAKLRKEVPEALKLAPNPARLVFQCVGKFYLQGRKAFSKGSHMTSPRKAALFVLEFFLLMTGSHDIDPSTKTEAENAAVAWRNRVMAECGLCNATHADARGLLLFVSCFGIPSIFSKDDLVDLMRLSNPRRIGEALQKSTFLALRTADIIEGLVVKGLGVEAVDVIYIFRLEHKFSPMRILMAFLKKLKEECVAVKKETNNNDPPFFPDKANLKKLDGLKSVVECLEAHKVDPEKLLPGLHLKDHIIRLEKDIVDRVKRKLDEVNGSRISEGEDAKRSRIVGEASSPSQFNGIHIPNSLSWHRGHPSASSPDNGVGTGNGLGALPGSVPAGIGCAPSSALGVQEGRPNVDSESQINEDRWTHDRLMAEGPPLHSATVKSHSFFGPLSLVKKFPGLPSRSSFGVSDRHSSSVLYQFADTTGEHDFTGLSSDKSRLPLSSSHSTFLF